MMLLEEMTWPEIESGLKRSKTIILPVGATEEHGPHLPIITDTAQAVEAAKEAARRRDIFVAPEISYGVCRSTKGFPGTITITRESLCTLAHDVLLSLYDSGFRNIMILTGHAGGQHLSALEEACQRAVAERDFRVSMVSLFDLFDMSKVEARGDGHAGELETSMMMKIRGDLVKGTPGPNFPPRPRFLVMKDVRHLMGNGIMGDPSRASLDKGKMFFEMAVQGVLGALDELESYPEH
ncbi:MAG TPA: creatininase family protein [Methanotrichaceae archaeon]|nr:creatininase family protein [Methanotrichaceae archaeon]